MRCLLVVLAISILFTVPARAHLPSKCSVSVANGVETKKELQKQGKILSDSLRIGAKPGTVEIPVEILLSYLGGIKKWIQSDNELYECLTTWAAKR